MPKPKYQDAFGRAPEPFNRFVENTLIARMEEDQMKLKHKSIGGVWILAIVLLLVVGTALALSKGLGILDFEEVKDPAALEARITDLREVPALESGLVRYQVTEALVDGDCVMITLPAEPLDADKYMLVSTDLDTAPMGHAWKKPARRLPCRCRKVSAAADEARFGQPASARRTTQNATGRDSRNKTPTAAALHLPVPPVITSPRAVHRLLAQLFRAFADGFKRLA